MTAPDQPPPDRPAPRARQAPGRWSIGFNVMVQIVLSLALFFGVNRISYRYHARWDLSPQQSFTLSPATLNLLERLSKDVFIANVFPRDAKIFGDLQTLLEEYRLNGRGRVKVRSIDPLRDIERAEELKAQTGLALDQNGVVIRIGDQTRFITESELVVREGGTEMNPKIKEFRGEDAVSSAILGAIEGTGHKFYLVVGKGARSEMAMVGSMAALGELGRQQNYQLLPLNLADVSRIPEDADGLMITGIRYDFTEREITMIRDYWNGKRAGILVMLDPSGETQRLDAFLDMNGVKPRGDRVLYAESTGTGARKEFSVQAAFALNSPVTRPLSASVTTLAGQTQSLALRTDDDQLRAQNITVTALMQASERYWGEMQYLEELPVIDEEDTAPPVYVAASVERGSVRNEQLRVDSCRMIVVGNASLLDKKTALAVNRDFVAASVNWLMNRVPQMGIMPKARHSYRIQLTSRQHELIFWITTMALPGMVLAIGLMIWAGRRAA